jgi:ATP-binding cassette subfamily B protein
LVAAGVAQAEGGRGHGLSLLGAARAAAGIVEVVNYHGSPMATFLRLLGFLRPYRRGVVASAVLAVLAIAFTVAIPALSGRAIDRIRDGDKAGLTALGLAVLGAGVLRFALTVCRRLVAGRVSLGVEVDLRNRMYEHLQELELGFFDRQQTGQLMSRATVDLQLVRFFLGYGLVFMLQSALTIVLASVAMFIVQPGLAAISLIPVPIVVAVAARYGRRSRPALQEVQQRIAELTADVEENIGGVRVVKSFAREDRQLERFRGSVGRLFDQAMVSTRLQAFYNPFIGFLPQLGLATILFYGGRQVIDGQLTIGQFSAFYTYLLLLLSPMRTLGISLGLAQRATAAGARVYQILDREPEITSPPGAPPLPPGAGHVELRHGSARYAGASRPALHDVDLDVPAGATVALVGATGSGKTTLVSLIARLYDVTEGAVLVDGADVRDVDVASLRSAIAMVNDDPFLFSATVAENIAYARADATREEIELAARRAQAHDFIERLPDGYDTRVGERGLTLSGGQRQRVAIARALLADPRILILDDATSSVDASTEQQIKQALREVMAGRTTFVIAHRLSTISLADTIVVLEDGELAAAGTHDELLDESELYREIVEKGLPDQVFLTRKEPERRVAGL